MRVLIPQQILSSAWQLFWTHRRAWFDLSIVPLTLSLLVQLLLRPNLGEIVALDPNDPATRELAASFMLSWVVFIAASIIIWAMFASAWMRFCLDLPQASSVPTGLSFNAPARGVAAGFIKLMLISVTVTLLILVVMGGRVPTLGALSGITLMALLASAPFLIRLSMMLPAAAAGQKLSLGGAWRMTRGNGLKLLFVVGIVFAGTFVAAALLEGLLAAIMHSLFNYPLSLGPRTLLLLIDGLIAFSTTAFLLATVSVCYRQLSGPGLQIVPQQRDRA